MAALYSRSGTASEIVCERLDALQTSSTHWEGVALRQEYAKPMFDELEVWLKEQLGKISSKMPLAKAIKYALARLPKARPYLDHGFLEFDNNTAERAVRPVAVGRKNYLFMGSEAGGKSAAIAYTLIETAKMNKVNPEAWLAWVL